MLKKMLVVLSDAKTRYLVKTHFVTKGYKVILCKNGNNALDLFKVEQPNILIFDIMISEIDGYMFCLNIRKESSIPIILVTTFSTIIDRLINFKIGVDDYITKPFYLSELEAKVKFLLWRTNTPEVSNGMLDMTIYIADFQIDIIKQQVLKGQQAVNLTKIEFTLLELLITKAGETLSRNFILNTIWGYTPKRYADTKLVDVHISRLRSKIEKDPRNPALIVTDWGKGYKFNQFQSQ